MVDTTFMGEKYVKKAIHWVSLSGVTTDSNYEDG